MGLHAKDRVCTVAIVRYGTHHGFPVMLAVMLSDKLQDLSYARSRKVRYIRSQFSFLSKS